VITTLFTFTGLIARDFLRILPKRGTPHAHLLAAEEWLKRAQDHGSDDGVSYGYSVRDGWRPSYRETSGYIATTFFDLAKHHGSTDYHQRALRICRWLLSVQNQDGSFSNPRYGPEGIVFDTGQVLFGLVRAYEENGDSTFKHGALKAADWLVNVADSEGHWTQNEHLNTPHVYNTRTAWALLRMNQIEHSGDRERVARANLDWALKEQRPNGFFDQCAFERGTAPFTHTIAYATRGLLEAGILLGDDRYISAAVRSADSALTHLEEDGFLPGQITKDGAIAATYCCLTGNCQFSIIWAKLFDRTGEEKYRKGTIRAMDYVMRRQNIQTGNLDVRGAIKGSFPIWGRYAPLSFPNWPAKFFVDAMLLRNRWL
jgi:hypothetical protein